MTLSYKINISVYENDTTETINTRIESALYTARTRLGHQYLAYREDQKIPGPQVGRRH